MLKLYYYPTFYNFLFTVIYETVHECHLHPSKGHSLPWLCKDVYPHHLYRAILDDSISKVDPVLDKKYQTSICMLHLWFGAFPFLSNFIMLRLSCIMSFHFIYSHMLPTKYLVHRTWSSTQSTLIRSASVKLFAFSFCFLAKLITAPYPNVSMAPIWPFTIPMDCIGYIDIPLDKSQKGKFEIHHTFQVLWHPLTPIIFVWIFSLAVRNATGV